MQSAFTGIKQRTTKKKDLKDQEKMRCRAGDIRDQNTLFQIE